MSQIKGKNTKPELLVRKYLFGQGFRFRIHVKTLPGKPDIVLPKYKTVIFVHGCFWHGHTGCKYFVIPKTRTEWWTKKIKKTSYRDCEHQDALIKAGWNVVVLWECELRLEKRNQTLYKLQQHLIHRSNTKH